MQHDSTGTRKDNYKSLNYGDIWNDHIFRIYFCRSVHEDLLLRFSEQLRNCTCLWLRLSIVLKQCRHDASQSSVLPTNEKTNRIPNQGKDHQYSLLLTEQSAWTIAIGGVPGCVGLTVRWAVGAIIGHSCSNTSCTCGQTTQSEWKCVTGLMQAYVIGNFCHEMEINLSKRVSYRTTRHHRQNLLGKMLHIPEKWGKVEYEESMPWGDPCECKNVKVLEGEGAKELVEVGCKSVRVEELQAVSDLIGEEQGTNTWDESVWVTLTLK